MISLADLMRRWRAPHNSPGRPAGAVDPPRGYSDWIAREKAAGRSYSMAGVAPAALPDSGETLALLRAIKLRVEAGARYWPDTPGTDTWGPLQVCQDPKHFNYGKRVGDCENFACSYLVEGLSEGIPRGALRLAVGPNLRGGFHALLAAAVEGPRRFLILDQALAGIWPESEHPLLRRVGWAWIRERPGWGDWWESWR